MSIERINYISTSTLDKLTDGIIDNLDNYRTGDFLEQVSEGGWNIELNYEADISALEDLDPSGGAEAEVENSIKVWQCFHEMTPALACENRLWTRLSHVECLEYTRQRWNISSEENKAIKDIKKHFFAPTLTGCRDDHSISRLWWNAKIAKVLRPNDQRGALELFLSKADIRQGLIERPVLSSRPVISRAILRALESDPWITQDEPNFRGLMKAVNFLGGGIVFELWSEQQLDDFIKQCKDRALTDIAEKAA